MRGYKIAFEMWTVDVDMRFLERSIKVEAPPLAPTAMREVNQLCHARSVDFGSLTETKTQPFLAHFSGLVAQSDRWLDRSEGVTHTLPARGFLGFIHLGLFHQHHLENAMTSVAEELAERVKRLIKAENERDRNSADEILSESFIAITRASGVEQSRPELLEQIADPPGDVRRTLDGATLWTYDSGEVGVVRSIVTVESQSESTIKHYRNMHVFERSGEHWRCLAWQVTEWKS